MGIFLRSANMGVRADQGSRCGRTRARRHRCARGAAQIVQVEVDARCVVSGCAAILASGSGLQNQPDECGSANSRLDRKKSTPACICAARSIGSSPSCSQKALRQRRGEAASYKNCDAGPSHPAYPNEGERGIKVCDRWRFYATSPCPNLTRRSSPRLGLRRCVGQTLATEAGRTHPATS
jgi:hypothetical protein